MTESEATADRPQFPSEVAAGGVVLTLTPDQVYVEFTRALSPPELEAIVAQYRLQPVRETSGTVPRPDRVEVPVAQSWFQSVTAEDTKRPIAELGEDERVRVVGPVYHRADLLPVVTGLGVADQMLVRFAPRASKAEIGALIAALEAEDVASVPDAREGPLHQLRLRNPKRQDIFAVVDEFAQSSLVRYAGPDWIQLHSPHSTITPNDTYFGRQWNLSQIAAPAGWDISQGDKSVIIAIVDSGCDLLHEDLSAMYVPVADRRDVIAKTNVPQDLYGHGTCCAGIAAAQTNNNLGVAGVAPNCSIMPIRLWDGRPNMVGIRSEMDIVIAIDWARTHGAHVVSMSWHWDAPHLNADVAFNNAYAANLVLAASSGNCVPVEGCTDPARISYPGSHPKVMAVGASDEHDQRKHLTSPDGEQWQSRYGPELSVMAPGVRCWTTDVTGSSGELGSPFNNNNGGPYTTGDVNYPSSGSPDGNYFSLMNGTSAAAPHVAGLAALLLSLLQHPVNASQFAHTSDLVRYIIEGTAMKVGGYPYLNDPAHLNGTWNQEMGYGRIDMVRALRFARDAYTPYKLERVSRDYALVVQILFGLISGGGGVVLPPGGPPVPVDPGWAHLTPEKRDVLLGLAITELADGINDPAVRQALGQVGWEAIERTARQMGHD